MYIVKNAFANIARNKGRNILMALILFVTLFASSVSIAIHQSSASVMKTYRKQFSSDIVLTRNDAKLPANIEDYREPNGDDYERFAQSKLLKKTVLQASSVASLANGVAIDENSGNNGGMQTDELVDQNATKFKMSTNMVIGESIENAKDQFTGTRKLVEGKLYANKSEVVISKELAKLNKWKVGDTIDVNITNYNNFQRIKVTLKISGLYEDSAAAYENEDEKGFASANRNNQMFVSLETVTEVAGKASVSARYIIKNPDDIDKLAQEFYDKGLPTYFDVSVDDAEFRKIVAPVEGLQSITLMFTIAILVTGALILMVISNIAIRERKYEIGVLRAMGMKKTKVALGLFMETFIITGMCLFASLGTAAVVQEPIANALYESQTENIEDNQISRIEVQLDAQTIALITLISLILAATSSSIAILYVNRYEPLKILSERN